MNLSIIRVITGYILKTMAALLLLPALVAVIYGEKQGVWYVIVSAACLLLGVLLNVSKVKSTVFYLKEGCVATAVSWLAMSVAGAFPFFLTGEIPHFVDAFFETVSGFTTTGASILPEVESMSHCSLFWRSFTHWIGGMGVLVFILAILPLTGGSNMNLMKAESPGPSVGKLVPKIKQTARILYMIYFGLTLIEIVALLISGLPAFDSICMSVGTAGTGGFGVKNDSAISYTVAQQWILTVFMFLFGVNFNAYYFIIFRQFKKAFGMEEVKHYVGIALVGISFITVDILHIYGSFADSVRHSSFQVATVMTTTGFSSVDFDTWPTLSKTILVTLMFVGACAGSTGGGIKVSRFIIARKAIRNEIHSYIHPKSVKQVELDGKAVEKEAIHSVSVYFHIFVAIFAFSLLIISFEGYDFTTNFTAITATINNIGPGLNLVGPTCNFSFFNDLSKIVMAFDMLAGRLELFPMLLLFSPTLWKEAVVREIRSRRQQ